MIWVRLNQIGKYLPKRTRQTFYGHQNLWAKGPETQNEDMFFHTYNKNLINVQIFSSLQFSCDNKITKLLNLMKIIIGIKIIKIWSDL